MANLNSLNTTEVEFKATSSPYRIAFRVDMKYYTVLYEQQRHRTGTSCSHPSNNVPQRLAERVWWTKSQSSPLNIYFRFSGFQSLLLLIHFRYGPNTCSHCTKVWHRTSPICDAQVSRAAQRSFALNSAEITVPICMNRSPIQYGFCDGVKAIWYSANIA